MRWKQLFEKGRETSINFKVLYDALRNLESTWDRDLLSKGEVRWAVTIFKLKSS